MRKLGYLRNMTKSASRRSGSPPKNGRSSRKCLPLGASRRHWVARSYPRLTPSSSAAGSATSSSRRPRWSSSRSSERLDKRHDDRTHEGNRVPDGGAEYTADERAPGCVARTTEPERAPLPRDNLEQLARQRHAEEQTNPSPAHASAIRGDRHDEHCADLEERPRQARGNHQEPDQVRQEEGRNTILVVGLMAQHTRGRRGSCPIGEMSWRRTGGWLPPALRLRA